MVLIIQHRIQPCDWLVKSHNLGYLDWDHTRVRSFQPITGLYSALYIKPRNFAKRRCKLQLTVVDPSHTSFGANHFVNRCVTLDVIEPHLLRQVRFVFSDGSLPHRHLFLLAHPYLVCHLVDQGFRVWGLGFRV